MGRRVGLRLGLRLGFIDFFGLLVGANEGSTFGIIEGSTVGTTEGAFDGLSVGVMEGVSDGAKVGTNEGAYNGAIVGTNEGTNDDTIVGIIEGTYDDATAAGGEVGGASRRVVYKNPIRPPSSCNPFADDVILSKPNASIPEDQVTPPSVENHIKSSVFSVAVKICPSDDDVTADQSLSWSVSRSIQLTPPSVEV